MNLFQKTLAITLAATSIAVVSTAIADEQKSPEEMAIEYRQGAFSMIKYHFGPMAAMVKGEKEFNAEAFAKNAEAVAALSKFPINGFIEGSDMGETEAKDAIWKNMDDFKKKMETFQVEAASLAEVAKGGDMAAIKPQFGKVGESCKACHKEYKED
ncbi:MAG TPA: cytochrome c [Candidatus Thiothrix moscowensis]|uniref:c-type cytochrome n=1 Tax=unclassified Thiothrix TaxID=2636184 RepID=UPI001A2BF4CB|nr:MULTISPECIES: cytochrome c [unclassified Thiothrix]MBJ6608943.1 cytochrome c [Candidatus Thiothrix moscowensis]HRJ53949.1 cytochrome c [Candidatus Thiothrix moscowensis]HRJ94031.1 cytochrome c [Candidatus Thiothrix moscowensis]